jgi:RHH-type transcriptional regulator, proline utilization regulon repressor / proline dehydrogenase / delta 1-pyrroline-5-carboxylate dehydrogenase
LLENTANESFLRASFTEHVPEEQLLRDPLAVGRMRDGQKDASAG